MPTLSTWFHSPNQVQVEYLCDVATSAASWVPLSVRQAAAADANQRAVARFINGPGIRCSAPIPLRRPGRARAPCSRILGAWLSSRSSARPRPC